MTEVVYGVCVGSWEKLQRNVVPRIGDRQLVAISGQISIAQAYSQMLVACRTRRRWVDMLVLLHDDLEILDPEAERKLLTAVSQPGVALAGVIGGVELASLYWWNSPTIIGHQATDSGLIDFGGAREGDVLFIEGSIMALSPWAIKYLSFDPAYPGFLGYDDICMQARSLGARTVVVDVDTHHHSTVGFKSDEIRRQFEQCEAIFQKKWGPDAP